jgi:hypothetical protein
MYTEYQSAMRLARDAVISIKAKPDGEADWETALRAVEASAADLLALIRRESISPNPTPNPLTPCSKP